MTEIKKQQDKHIAIIGAGDAAFDYALSLSKYNIINILNRSDRINATKELQENVST